MELGLPRWLGLTPSRMLLCALLGWAVTALGHAAQGQEQPAAQEAAAAPAATLLGPDELRKLVAPIALYPDELLAVFLPAATNPPQGVRTHRYIRQRQTHPKL